MRDLAWLYSYSSASAKDHSYSYSIRIYILISSISSRFSTNVKWPRPQFIQIGNQRKEKFYGTQKVDGKKRCERPREAGREKRKWWKCSKTLVLNTFIEMVSLFISSDLNKQAERVGHGAKAPCSAQVEGRVLFQRKGLLAPQPWECAAFYLSKGLGSVRGERGKVSGFVVV